MATLDANSSEARKLQEQLSESSLFCNLLDNPDFNLYNPENLDLLLHCFPLSTNVKCSLIRLSSFVEFISNLYSVFQVHLKLRSSGQDLMFYNYEKMSEENFLISQSQFELNKLMLDFFRMEFLDVLAFTSRQYNLEFNNNIFWIFVAVVFFGILNLGFILLLLENILSRFRGDLEIISNLSGSQIQLQDSKIADFRKVSGLNFREMDKLFEAHKKYKWLREFWSLFANPGASFDDFEQNSKSYLDILQKFGLQEDSIFCYEFILVKSYKEKNLEFLIKYATTLTGLYENKLKQMFEFKTVHQDLFAELFGKLFLVNKFKLKSYEKMPKEDIGVNYQHILREFKNLELYLHNSENSLITESIELLLIKVELTRRTWNSSSGSTRPSAKRSRRPRPSCSTNSRIRRF